MTTLTSLHIQEDDSGFLADIIEAKQKEVLFPMPPAVLACFLSAAYQSCRNCVIVGNCIELRIGTLETHDTGKFFHRWQRVCGWKRSHIDGKKRMAVTLLLQLIRQESTQIRTSQAAEHCLSMGISLQCLSQVLLLLCCVQHCA